MQDSYQSPQSPQSPTMAINSRLPHVGTTIFSVMSALALEHQAVNLGQGFPDFDCDPALLSAVHQAMQQGHNQYAPMAGLPVLRQAVAEKIAHIYHAHYHPETEITITAGATQGILTAILCCVHPGDEVIVLDPCYDSYVPNIELAGATAVRVPLQPGSFRPDFAKIAAAITPKTRLLIINTPHNPTATVWTAEEMQQLADILKPTNILLLSDEVYEHMVYAPQSHQSVACYPELAKRAFIISSFGKTYHVTGWIVGTVAAPAPWMAEFRKVHQFNVFSVNTPMQKGLADYMQEPQHHLGLAAFYEKKRNLFLQGLKSTRLRPLVTQGTYFQCVDISAATDLSEADFCRWLIEEIGVAAIPLSAFYADGFDQKIIHFCFAKKDSTLENALARLRKI